MKLKFRNAAKGDHNVECTNLTEVGALKQMYLDQVKDEDIKVE